MLTGENGGGKSATIDALAFLLDGSVLADADRTYLDSEPESAVVDGRDPTRPRSPETWVEGTFVLTEAEQESLGLPEVVKIRRYYHEASGTRLEVMRDVPADPLLRDLASLNVTELRKLARDNGLETAGVKAELVGRLEAFARESPQTKEWVKASTEIGRALPRLIMFGGRTPSADDEVRKVLNSRYQEHLMDPALQGKIADLEEDLRRRVTADATDLCRHVEERCPDLLSVRIEPDVSFKSGLSKTEIMVSKLAGEPVALAASGTGRNRRVTLAVWEWTNLRLAEDGEDRDARHTIVAYDEPDTYLDYKHQRRVMDLIRSQCQLPNVSVIVATHSLNLIDGVDISKIVHLKLDGERTIVERFIDGTHDDASEHLASIASALGVRNSVLLYERLFVGVEGPTEQQAFPLLFRLCQGMHLQSAGIALWACNNNEGALHFARFLNDHGRKVAFVVDNDSRTRARSIFSDTKLRQYGINPERQARFIGQPNELEELFTDTQWAEAANRYWPRNDGVKWSAEQIAAWRDPKIKKFSDALLENFKAESDTGPASKVDLMFKLAAGLTDAEQVPEALRELFAELAEIANS